VLPRRYAGHHFAYAYALTADKAQGMTVDDVLFAPSAASTVERGYRQEEEVPVAAGAAVQPVAGTSIEDDRYAWRADKLRDTPAAVRFLSLEPLLGPLPSLDLAGIDWVIVGGESGPRHRPIDPEWVRQLRDRCVDALVAFFFKQWGGRIPKAGGRRLDGRTWGQMPPRMQSLLVQPQQKGSSGSG
jgi:hypothetical protein